MVDVHPVIVDTDPGVDDVIALMFLFASPKVHVRAITLTHGNTHLNHIKRNAVTLLNAMQKEREAQGVEIPLNQLPVLAIGSATPLKSGSVFATSIHGADGLGDIYEQGKYSAPPDWEEQLLHKTENDTSSPRAFQTTERDAADEILYQLKQVEPLTMSILAIGPLTNVALAYQRDPVTFSRVKRVVIIGGAVDTPGNTTPFAEFNFYADPFAADTILSASKYFKNTPEGHHARKDFIQQGKQAPVHVVVFPLPGVCDGCIPAVDYNRYVEPLKTPLFAFCNSFLKWASEVSSSVYGLDFIMLCDAYAGFLMLDLDDCNFDKNWEYRYLDLRVETTGKYTLGAACYDQRDWNQDQPSWGDVPNNVHVITRGNSARFNRILLSRTFGAAIEEK